MHTVIRLSVLCLPLVVGAPALGAAPPQVVLSADAASTSAVYHRVLDGSTIGSSASVGDLGGDAKDVMTLRSPDLSRVVYLTLNASGQVGARVRNDRGVGTETVVATGVPVATPSPLGAGYFSPGGTLAVAYGTTGSSTCWVRTLSGTTLGTATATPLSLSSAPAKVRVASRPGSNEVLIVAQDSSLRLAATVWNGTAFRATSTIDAAYTGGVNRWECAWTRAGEAVIVLANDASTGTSVVSLVGDTWTAVSSAPTAAGAISRVMISEDPRQPGGGLAVGTLSSGGVLEVTTRNAGVWSATSQVATSVDTSLAVPAAISFEGTGGGLVAAWLVASSEQVRVSRKAAGGSWSTAALSGSLGTGLQSVALTARDDADGVVLTARRTSTASGSSLGTMAGYVAYSSTGTVTVRDRATTTGLVGANVSGVTLPAEPTGTAGSSNVTVSNDGTVTLAPGNYQDLSFGDRSRINVSAGTYVFRKVTGAGYDNTFAADTSGGDISIIVLQNAVTFRDRWIVTNTGSGTLTFHVLGGQLTLGYDSRLTADFISYNGALVCLDRARFTGHLAAKNNITLGYDGAFAIPSGSSGGGSGGSSGHRLHAMLVSAGSIGSATELTSADFSGTAAPAVAVTSPAVKAVAKVVRWRETAP